jgi:hypothetical protein
MTETIKSKYARLVGELIARVPQEAQVSEINVYQEGIASILPYIDTIIRDYLDDCSAIEGAENLEALYAHAQKGESIMEPIRTSLPFSYAGIGAPEMLGSRRGGLAGADQATMRIRLTLRARTGCLIRVEI